MNAVSKISGLFEDIYDAALEPARWDDVVAGINTFVGGRACGIVTKDPVSKLGKTQYYYGADPHYIKLYADGYARFDPLVRLPAPGRVVSIPDLVSYDEYRRGPFYQEWLRPQDCVDTPSVLLDDSDSAATLLTFLVGKEIMDTDMRRRIALIAPHVKRSLMINRAIEYKACQASTFADTLDRFSAGIFIVDAQCRIVHANVAGRQLLSEDHFLRSIGGQLVACDRQVNRGLREGVARGEAGITAGCTAFSLTAHDGEHYVAHVLPLKSAMRASLEASSIAVAAVFVRKVELNGQSYGGIVARTFGLTPAELRVMLTIVEVGGVPETSERLGVAETTVKTHLYRVFSKTGANRQADLVKLAAGFSNPLAN